MTTLYKSLEITRGDPVRSNEKGVFAVYGQFTCPGTAFILNDVVQMVKVPANCRVLSVDLYVDRLDTGATPTVAMDVGDATTPALYIAATIIGQAAAGQVSSKVATYGVASGFAMSYAADATIQVLIKTAAQTGITNSTIKLVATCSKDLPTDA